MTDLQKTEKAVTLSRLLLYKKGQITRDTNRFPSLLVKYQTEKQNGSCLVYVAAQAALKCITLSCQLLEDLREQADAYNQLLLMHPDGASESDTNAKIATLEKCC